MELSDLQKRELRPVEGDFDGLKVVVNVNAVTGRFYRLAAEQIRAAEAEQKPEFEKRAKLAVKYSTLQEKLTALAEQLQIATDDVAREQITKQMAAVEKQITRLLPSDLDAFEGRGKEIEAKCDLYAKLIKGTEDVPLLMEWDLTDEGEPVPCTVEELRKRHPDLLADLYYFCTRVDHPKSLETRTIATNRTTSDSTVATISPLDTQTDASLTM